MMRKSNVNKAGGGKGTSSVPLTRSKSTGVFSAQGLLSEMAAVERRLSRWRCIRSRADRVFSCSSRAILITNTVTLIRYIHKTSKIIYINIMYSLHTTLIRRHIYAHMRQPTHRNNVTGSGAYHSGSWWCTTRPRLVTQG